MGYLFGYSPFVKKYEKNGSILLLQFSIDANELWNRNLLLHPIKQAKFIPSIFVMKNGLWTKKGAITQYNTNIS